MRPLSWSEDSQLLFIRLASLVRLALPPLRILKGMQSKIMTFTIRLALLPNYLPATENLTDLKI
jgi:hypothetical protein